MTRSTPAPAIEIAVESPLWDALPDAEELVHRAVAAALACEDLDFIDQAELSVLLADDARITELNREWRGRDEPTNVLSFPAAEPDEIADAPMIGDIALAYETLAREAARDGIALGDHFQHLVVHGVLHLFGYDHIEDGEAEVMEDAERRALASIGISDPYQERPAARAAGS